MNEIELPSSVLARAAIEYGAATNAVKELHDDRISVRWGDVAALVKDHRELEAIVRDLASLDDPFVQGDIFEGSACRYCDAPLSTLHTDDCDWRRAREWVAAHPTEAQP